MRLQTQTFYEHVQVGNLTEDARVWERPEQIVAGRPVYSISTADGECPLSAVYHLVSCHPLYAQPPVSFSQQALQPQPKDWTQHGLLQREICMQQQFLEGDCRHALQAGKRSALLSARHLLAPRQ